MSGPGLTGEPAKTPWHRYLDREHAARDMYLRVTTEAQREYLTGPWPDRDAYQTVERQAWLTYYHAGRDAWRQYTAEITPPPPPPITRDASSVTERINWIEQQAGQPYHDQPGFTPTNGGTDKWPSR